MYKIKILFVLLLPVMVSAESYKYAGEFLRLGAGARAAGMADAVTPLINDATATYWNPAGLAGLQMREAAFMHSELYGGTMQYDAVSYAVPVKGVGGIGITLIRLGLNGIIPITSIADTSQPVGANNPATVDQYMSSADYALLLGHGMRFKIAGLQGGITMKIIRREIGEYYAHGIGADLGLQYALPAGGAAGITIRDITGSIIAWDNGTRDYITPTVIIGGAYTRWVEEVRGELTLSGSYCPDAFLADAGTELSTSPVERYIMDPFIAGGVGVEYAFKKTVFIRAGTVNRNVTAGFGLTYAGFNADYAFTMYNTFQKKDMHDDLERTHRVSGSYRF